MEREEGRGTTRVAKKPNRISPCSKNKKRKAEVGASRKVRNKQRRLDKNEEKNRWGKKVWEEI